MTAIVKYVPRTSWKLQVAKMAMARANRITATDLRRGRRALKRVRRVYSRARRARRAARSRVYNAPSAGIQHRDYVYGNTAQCESLTRKTLNIQEVKFCLPPNTNETIGAAPGMAFVVSGTKMCFNAQYVDDATELIPIQLHVALIQPKSDQAQTPSDFKTDWFRDPSSSTDKDLEFVDYATEPAYDNRYVCSNLSQNGKNILFHKRFIMLPPQTAGSGREINGWRNIHWEKYIKLNKRFEYETTSATNVRRPLYIATWFDYVRSPVANSGTFTGLNNGLRLQCSFQSYLKRPSAKV